MARAKSETLTTREAQIMDALWRLGEATSEQVREALPGLPHDSTVRTLLRVLETKGFVTRQAGGKAHLFRARVPRRKAQSQALRAMLGQLFGGSAQDLVLRLIEDERLAPEELDELRRIAGSIPNLPVEAPRRRSAGNHKSKGD